jgi:hypothetical protein
MADHLFSGVSEQTRAATQRKTDALTLRSQERWRGAMYLMGYAVECKLEEGNGNADPQERQGGN